MHSGCIVDLLITVDRINILRFAQQCFIVYLSLTTTQIISTDF
jgi:hypothetical protein